MKQSIFKFTFKPHHLLMCHIFLDRFFKPIFLNSSSFTGLLFRWIHFRRFLVCLDFFITPVQYQWHIKNVDEKQLKQKKKRKLSMAVYNKIYILLKTCHSNLKTAAFSNSIQIYETSQYYTQLATYSVMLIYLVLCKESLRNLLFNKLTAKQRISQ